MALDKCIIVWWSHQTAYPPLISGLCYHCHFISSCHNFSLLRTVAAKNELHLLVTHSVPPREKKSSLYQLKIWRLDIKISNQTEYLSVSSTLNSEQLNFLLYQLTSYNDLVISLHINESLNKMTNCWLQTKMLFSHSELCIKWYKGVNDYEVYK